MNLNARQHAFDDLDAVQHASLLTDFAPISLPLMVAAPMTITLLLFAMPLLAQIIFGVALYAAILTVTSQHETLCFDRWLFSPAKTQSQHAVDERSFAGDGVAWNYVTLAICECPA